MHQLMAEECGDAIGGDEELNDSDGQPLRRFPGQHRVCNGYFTLMTAQRLISSFFDFTRFCLVIFSSVA